MKKLLIMTDSNSGIKIDEGKNMDVFVVPMPFFIDGQEYLEELTLSQDEFYKFLKNDSVNISTSQPSAYYLRDLFKKHLKEYEQIIYIPMMSSLSATCASAISIAAEFDERVHVIDNLRISITQKESVYEAVAMRDKGYSCEEIVKYLLDTKHIASIYIYLDTLKYLKKGGRIKPAAAALANLLGIRPVLYTRGEKFDTYAKVRSITQAKRKMIDKVKSELETEFKEYYDAGKMIVSIAHTQNYEEALKFKDEILAALPKIKFRFIDALSLSVSCHIGSGALAIAISINSFLD
ncbi:MAG: DegV family protein [Erysipelotrichales bacterium]|nr:DegV family protein [Erysipelotrichales bacterium]